MATRRQNVKDWLSRGYATYGGGSMGWAEAIPDPPAGATWSPTAKNANVTLSADKLTATVNVNGPADAAGLATLAITSGQKVYLEAILEAGSGGELGLGFGNASTNFADGQWLGIDGNSLCTFNGGNTYTGGAIVVHLASSSVGNRMGIAIDRQNNSYWIINITTGGTFGGAYDPATNTGGLGISAILGDIFPGYNVSYAGGVQGSYTLVQPASYANAPPTGFTKYGA